jgi:uncharacterized protein with FMN-binding domain
MEAASTFSMTGSRGWRLSHGGLPATAWAEGAQFNGRPSLQTAALPSAPLWDDGSSIGVHDALTPPAIRVAVDIASGRIVTIRVLHHPGWRAPEEQEKLLRLVVASQTTEGHVARGTGSEQDHLLRAIDDALTKALSLSQRCRSSSAGTRPHSTLRRRYQPLAHGFAPATQRTRRATCHKHPVHSKRSEPRM